MTRPKREKTGGRKKGTPNKVTAPVKREVLRVFQRLQKDPNFNLLKWAKRSDDNAREFYKIAAKLIPTEIMAELRTPNDDALIKVIKGIDPDKILTK